MANDPDLDNSGQFNVNSGSETIKEAEDVGNPNAPNVLFYAAQNHLDGMDKEDLKKSMEEVRTPDSIFLALFSNLAYRLLLSRWSPL